MDEKSYGLTSIICVALAIISIAIIGPYSRYLFFLAIFLGVLSIEKSIKNKTKKNILAIISIVLGVLMILLMLISLYQGTQNFNSVKNNHTLNCEDFSGNCLNSIEECKSSGGIYHPYQCENDKICCVNFN